MNFSTPSRPDSDIQQLIKAVATLKVQLLTATNQIQDLISDKQQLNDRIFMLRAWKFFENYDSNPHHDYVYVLRLEDQCYYVGETSHLRSRLASHFNGEDEAGYKCAYWTTHHHPIALAKLLEFSSETPIPDLKKQETLETINQMRAHGFRNVRGGAFVADDENELQKLLQSDKRQHDFNYTFDEIAGA
ncbi:GIY-YIG nuclease family protein [Levilactobacillus suantsaii]|uniref:Uncharacterized protein n=1 Tax=Levilactobacillus suantsaii TaxID=2292255 RepID=A0A4V1LFN3_9LACO|nr:GIY-YIG nuclease family protein [Levilactobacillus suantsaii]QMU07240.1 GIY-YIG nuclease family protein [Levilactobacillus suantsaii]RXI80005.1 hypothetical protein DXH47_00080 [Levilactobacillus suantsaii]